MGEDMDGLPLEKHQLDIWHRDGFLILKNVLSSQEVTNLLSEAGAILAKHESGASSNTSQFHGKNYYNIHNPFDHTDGLDYLLDHPKTFDVVTYL